MTAAAAVVWQEADAAIVLLRQSPTLLVGSSSKVLAGSRDGAGRTRRWQMAKEPLACFTLLGAAPLPAELAFA
jgi:hypothetical protein